MKKLKEAYLIFAIFSKVLNTATSTANADDGQFVTLSNCQNHKISGNNIFVRSAVSPRHCAMICLAYSGCTGFNIEKQHTDYSCEFKRFSAPILHCTDALVISAPGINFYVKVSKSCDVNDCSVDHGSPCVAETYETFVCSCEAGYGWQDPTCARRIPYFWSDYNNGISNDYWNYGATTTTGPWSGAISVAGSTYITIRDSNQAAQYNSDKCPWSTLTCATSGTGMTVSILAELTDYGTSNVQKLIRSSHGANLVVDTSGRMIAKVIKFQQWQWVATPPTTVTYGEWSHWLLTWSESTGVLLYHNGSLLASDNTGTTFGGGTVDTMFVGNTVAGKFDNLAVWPSFFTQEEVTSLFNLYFPN